MATQKTLLTADEFYDFCCKNDGRYELVRGEVVELSPVNEAHGMASIRIGAHFFNFLSLNPIGEVFADTGYRLEQDPDTVRGPDIAFLTRERLAGRSINAPGFRPGPPDLAIEVISPSNRPGEMRRKLREYFESGARRVWYVYPVNRSVSAHFPDGSVRHYTEDDTLEDPELLPGFSLPVRAIFTPLV